MFAKEGAKVVCADLNEAGVQKCSDKINEAYGKDASIAFKIDVSKEAQVKELVQKAVDTYGTYADNRIFQFVILT